MNESKNFRRISRPKDKNSLPDTGKKSRFFSKNSSENARHSNRSCRVHFILLRDVEEERSLSKIVSGKLRTC